MTRTHGPKNARAPRALRTAHGATAARAHARAVHRLRARAVALASLPAAVFAVLLAGGLTGRLGASGAPDAPAWDAARWAVGGLALLVLLWTLAFTLLLRRVRLPRTPAVDVPEPQAPELYRLIGEAAALMDVPAPAAIALTPDCDSWLEDTAPSASASPAPAPAPASDPDRDRDAIPAAPQTLVIGSPFLWWMRPDELRALLAPVIAGTACAADPEIASARRFVRALDALCVPALSFPTAPDPSGRNVNSAAVAPAWASIPARFLLRRCRGHAAELEHAVAAWSAERAREVDYGLRVAAQEQVGLAYAGWDRLLSRVALPAWQEGLRPRALGDGVAAALAELSRRDRLAAEGYGTRLTQRPARDLLTDPAAVDEQVSLLAARLYFPGVHDDPAAWPTVEWADYPERVAERIWRRRAAALVAAVPVAPDRALAEVLRRLRSGAPEALAARLAESLESEGSPSPAPVAPPDLLAEHLTALVCCTVLDAGAARPGLDWLDGPVLLLATGRRADVATPVSQAIEAADQRPLLDWLHTQGTAPDHPLRLH